MATSLQKLVSNLDNDLFQSLRQHFPHKTDLLLRIRKGVYPYEYTDSFEKFEERRLPSTDAFTSTLSNEKVTEEGYQHAQNVWQAFHIKYMGDYHNLYVKLMLSN